MVLKFRAKLSKYSLVLTIIFNVLIIYVSYVLAFRNDLLKHINQPPEIVKYIVLALLIVAILLAYLLHPVKYIVTEKEIKIIKPLFSTKLLLSSIVEIKPISYDRLDVRFRLFGSGGVWGFFGLFNSFYYGIIHMNTSNLKDLVFISINTRKIYIISPENPEKFIETVSKKQLNAGFPMQTD